MEHHERQAPRHQLSDFEDFSVQALMDDGSFQWGMLANLSAGGLCVILPGGAPFSAESQVLRGNILSSRLPRRVDFEGDVVWIRRGVRIAGEEFTLVGLRFSENANLPAALQALERRARILERLTA